MEWSEETQYTRYPVKELHLKFLYNSLLLHSTLPAPEVTISPGDSIVTAGVSHTVQCTVTYIPFLAVSLNVELIGPGDIVLAIGMSFTLTHTLYPVMTSHAGQYTCRASVGVDVSESSSTLTVRSMYTICMYIYMTH